jgi:23S rRNA A2030 N6-methylase RlmJ
MKAVQLNRERFRTHMNSAILGLCFLVVSAPWSLAQQVKVSAPAVNRTKAEQEIAALSEQKWRLDVRPQGRAARSSVR